MSKLTFMGAQGILHGVLWLAFSLALFTSLLPGQRLQIHWSGRVGWVAVAGLVLLGACRWGAHRLFARLRSPQPELCVNRVMRPCAVLAVPPLFTFILYPLGVPLQGGVLIDPFFVVLVATGLGVAALVRELVAGLPERVHVCLQGWGRHATRARLMVVLFLGFSTLYGVAVLHNNRVRRLVGDEPEYLFIMESVKRYQTADLTPLLHDSDASYTGGIRRIRPHRSGESREGTIYSVHHLGTPLLMIPFHVLGGYYGAMLLFVLVCALCVTNLYLYLEELGGKRLQAFGLAILAGVTVPFSHYFRFIYPDLPATLFMLYAYRKFRVPTRSTLQFGLAAVLAAYLPWLHVKYLLLSLALLIMALRPVHWGRWAFLACAYAISAVSMMIYFWIAFESILPNAQYGGNNPPFSPFFWRGAPGLFIDRDHGLLAWSPYLAFALIGLVPFWRRAKPELPRIAFMAIPSFIVVASHWMWWGGPCPPARFILPLVPFLFPLLLWGLPRIYGSPFWRTLFEVSLVFSLLVAVDSLINPDDLPFHRHIAYQRFMGLNAFPVLPLFFIHRTVEVPWSQYISAWVYLGMGAILVWVGVSRRRGIDRHAVETGLLAVFLLAGGMSLFQSLLYREVPMEYDQPRQLARMTYALEQYEIPLQRAGMTAGRVPLDHTINLPIDRQAAAVLTPANYTPGQDRWVLWGQYSNLYPLHYQVDFHIRVKGEPGTVIGYLDIAANRGETILAEKPILADGDPSERVMTLSVRPARMMNSTEFRCRMVNYGEVHIMGLHVRVTPAPPAEPPRD